jgi:Big-like domain-containing protein/thrombospondin type 3 repeat protein
MSDFLVFVESFNAIALLLIILTITQYPAMEYMITTKITKVFALSPNELVGGRSAVPVKMLGQAQPLPIAAAATTKTTTTTPSPNNNNSNNSNNNQIINGSKDSDGDGLSDVQEVNTYRTNPLSNDTDGDRLSDGKEVIGWAWTVEEKRGCTSSSPPSTVCHILKTNPLNPDTDGDRNSDYYEYTHFGSDPNNPDQDNDGLLDGLESGPNAIYHTSYFLADTDHDGFPDGQEVKMGTDPLNPNDHPIAGETSSPNAPPTANAQRVVTANKQRIDITLTGSDPDGNQIYFFIYTNPNHGSLSPIQPRSPTSAQVTYTPALNYAGADWFTFLAYDGKAYSNPTTVSITVYPQQPLNSNAFR